MYRTGVATQMAEFLVAAIGGSNPTMLLAGLFLFTAILGQVISNTATAMIVIPIAIMAAGELGISAKPVLMSLNVGASAAFLTPVATASNLIVMGPGGYRFRRLLATGHRADGALFPHCCFLGAPRMEALIAICMPLDPGPDT